MQILRRVLPLVTFLALTLLIAACGDAASRDTTTQTGAESDFGFGEPADPSDANRTVEVVASDDLTFDPAEISVVAGETVTFRITNDGRAVHDFTLGDQATQNKHEAEMSEGAMDHDAPNVVDIPAGETVELTWTFGDAGMVLIGCHQPGHYAAGMTGQITVEG